MPPDPLLTGLAIAGVYLVLMLACFLVAKQMATPDIPDQTPGEKKPKLLDHTDAIQQQEIERLTRVDKHFDTRLDKLESKAPFPSWFFLGVMALNILAALVQVLEVFK